MMTWRFQVSLSDDVHRVLGPDGESAWGIDHRGFDADSPRSIGTADVELPTGRTSLLLVPALPGGLVLDVVRAYQGLTDGELCTLFLGIVSALRDCTAAEERLSLTAFGLDVRGRPILIPGVSAPLATSPRRAMGEMLYQAGYGRPWSECLLPVNLALADSSSALRAVVGELLASPTADVGLSPALVEVAESMRMLAEPAPLPLVPAEREVDPEAALTARLRAASGHPSSRSTRGATVVQTETADDDGPAPGRLCAERDGLTRRGDDVLAGSAPVTASTSESLRAASRRPRPRRGHRDGQFCLARWHRPAVAALRAGSVALRDLRPRGPLIIGAICLALCGGAILWGSWPGADARNDESSSSQAAGHGPRPQRDAGDGDAGEARSPAGGPVRILEELCSARAKALSDGDEAALQKLTLPGSAAAAADELIDAASFAGSDYSIRVDDVAVVEADEERIVATAQMHSSAGRGDSREEFDTVEVEFELARRDGRWMVEEVTETGHE